MSASQRFYQLLRLQMQIDVVARDSPELAACAARLLDLMERYRWQLEPRQ